MQSVHIKDSFASFVKADAAQRDNIVLELTAWALKHISKELILELGGYYEVSAELYRGVARRLLPDADYGAVVAQEIERLGKKVLGATDERDRPQMPSAVQQLVQKHGSYPANLPLMSFAELLAHIFGISSDKTLDAVWLETLRENADLAQTRLIVVDKSSKNNVVYQAKTLIDYEFIRERGIYAPSTAGVSRKVQERTRTIDTLPVDPSFAGATTVYDLGPSDAQSFNWIEKHGPMYSVTVIPESADSSINDCLHPDARIEAYNALMEGVLIGHLRRVKKTVQVIAKSDIQGLRDKILAALVEIISQYVNSANVSDLRGLTGLVRRDAFYADLIRKIQDIILDSILSQHVVSEHVRRELQLTFLYEMEGIVRKFRSMFEYAYYGRQDKFRNILEKYNSQALINEHIVNLMQYMVSDILRRLIADRKSISQMLNVKYNMLKQYD